MGMRSTSFRPIGYWVKLLDELIEDNLDHALRPLALTRRLWQLLNLLASGPRTQASIAAELAAFLSDDDLADALLLDAQSHGLVQSDDGSVALTDEGRRRHRAAADAVNVARSRTSEHIDPTEYKTTIETLETMCRNLGWTPPT